MVLRLVIVVSRFNEILTDQLLEGARKALQGAGMVSEDLTVIRVPGADEIPLAVDAVLQKTKPDAVLTLGCVITGETEHARIILEQVARSIPVLARQHQIPVINGVVSAGSMELGHGTMQHVRGKQRVDLCAECHRNGQPLQAA